MSNKATYFQAYLFNGWNDIWFAEPRKTLEEAIEDREEFLEELTEEHYVPPSHPDRAALERDIEEWNRYGHFLDIQEIEIKL